jgi:hypothetical protein
VSTTFNKRLLIVWSILTSMTLAYVWMDHTVDQNGTIRASTVVTVSAIVIAVCLLGSYFVGAAVS